MQGGMVSAITAEAASSATVEPGFCPDLREAGISTAPTAATSAIFEPEMPENSTMARDHHHIQAAAHAPDQALQQFDQPHRHAVGFHQVANQNEKRDRQQHEIVDAARHLLGKDHAGQGALGPDEDQRRQRQRKADRQATGEREREARAASARREDGMASGMNASPNEKNARHGGEDGGRARDTSASLAPRKFRRQTPSCRPRPAPSDRR